MLARLAFAAALALIAAGAAVAPAPIVFFDIAGADLAAQSAFYKTVFGWEADPQGRLTVPAATPMPGLLRVEAPNQGPVAERILYIGVPDITAALAKITANGGAVVFPRTEVPGIVILALLRDPAGNRMGLVEMDGDKPRVPKPHP